MDRQALIVAQQKLSRARSVLREWADRAHHHRAWDEWRCPSKPKRSTNDNARETCARAYQEFVEGSDRGSRVRGISLTDTTHEANPCPCMLRGDLRIVGSERDGYREQNIRKDVYDS